MKAVKYKMIREIILSIVNFFSFDEYEHNINIMEMGFQPQLINNSDAFL